jgi:hypothetical protein
VRLSIRSNRQSNTITKAESLRAKTIREFDSPRQPIGNGRL